MKPTLPLPLVAPLLLALVLGAAPGVARAETGLSAARQDFVKTRNTCDLADALTSPDVQADVRAPTDVLLAFLACDRAISLASAGAVGYAALPELVVALRGMDLNAAADAAERIGGEAGGLGLWARALVLARHGRDDEAMGTLLGASPATELDVEDVLFPLALLGASLPPDDRLLLAAVGREALLDACRRGGMDRVVGIARRVAALDPIIGGECVCLAGRALRRGERIEDVERLLEGPESATNERTVACLLLELAISELRNGRPESARQLVAGLPTRGAGAAFLVDAITRCRTPIGPLPSAGAVPQASGRGAASTVLARFATLLGTGAGLRAVEAAALEAGCDASEPGFAATWLASQGLQIVETAGSSKAGIAALASGLPFLLWRLRLVDEAFEEEPVIVRARDPDTGLWIVDTCDLRLLDALPADAPLKGRLLVAVPTDQGDPSAWAPAREQVLGRTLAAALGEAAAGDLPAAIRRLEGQEVSLGADPVFQTYLAWLYHRLFFETRDPTSLHLAWRAVERARGSRPDLAFEHVVRGQGLLAEGERGGALGAFTQAAAAEPTSPYLARVRFGLLMDGGRTVPALEELDRAHGLDPRDTTALWVRGRTRAIAGDVPGARRDLRRVFDRRPESKDVALALIDLELDNGNPEAAVRAIDEFVARVPSSLADEHLRDRRQNAEGDLVRAAATVPELAPFLESPLSTTRRRVVFALARLESEEAETELRRILSDEHHAVRVTALRVFMRPWLRARIEADDALGTRVVALLEQDESAVVRGAAAGLLSLVARPYAAERLAAALVGAERDADAYVRSEAAGALARHDGPLARAALVEALGDDAPIVRRAAIAALFKLAFTYHGYDPEAPKDERAAAVARWRQWLGETAE